MVESVENAAMMRRLALLEQTVNEIEAKVNIAMDTRIDYLEAQFIKMVSIKQTVDEMNKMINDIYKKVGLKSFPQRTTDKQDVDVA
jgi:hypothetical protein